MTAHVRFALFMVLGCDSVTSVAPDAEIDTSPPQIATTQPSDGAGLVSLSASIVIEFSEAMDPASVTLALSPPATLVAEWPEPMTATFRPVADLTPSTGYTATVTGLDLAGNELAGTATFSFTTEGGVDTTPPALESSIPADQATGVDPLATIALTFSEPMATGTVQVLVEPPFDLGPPTWSEIDRVVTFAPAALPPSSIVMLGILGQDKSGNALSPTTLSFTTAAPPDAEPPTVLAGSPLGTGVPTNSVLSVTFTEPMDQAATQAAFTVSPAVSCSFAWSGATVTCTPAAVLSASTSFAVTVGTGARDAAGNALAAPYTWSFTTAAAPDTTPPTVTGFTPAEDAIGLPRATGIEVTFSESMNRVATESAFLIGLNGGTLAPRAGTFTWTGRTMRFQPEVPFAYSDMVRWRVTVAATDSAGNSLAAAVTHNFVVIRRVTVTVTSSAGLDGYVRQDLTYNSTVDYLNVGDRSDGLAVYGFVSFDSSMVPAGATITGATLTVYQESVTNYPFGSTRLGSLEVERVAYGSSLSGSDFNVAASPSVAIVIGNDAQIEPKAAELVSIAGACAGAATCQFRLRFTRDTEAPSDGEFDYVTISSAESSVASRRPTLRLTWETP